MKYKHLATGFKNGLSLLGSQVWGLVFGLEVEVLLWGLIVVLGCGAVLRLTVGCYLEAIV